VVTGVAAGITTITAQYGLLYATASPVTIQ
jgi:hypothetical protein